MTELLKQTIKLKRKFSGSYTCRVWYKDYIIERNDEQDSSWKGQWIIKSADGYSDPMPTLRDCRNALQDMQNHPEQYGFELIYTITHYHVQTSEPMTRTEAGYEVPVKLAEAARNQVYKATNGDLYLRNGYDLVAIAPDFDEAVAIENMKAAARAGDKAAYEAAYQQSGLSYPLKWCIWLGYLPELKMTGTYIPTSERDYRGRIRTV